MVAVRWLVAHRHPRESTVQPQLARLLNSSYPSAYTHGVPDVLSNGFAMASSFLSPSAGLDFVAVDFETANPDPSSVCQVGVARVLRGQIVATDSWYVVPPTGPDSFEPSFSALHGITAETVRREGFSWYDSVDHLHRVTRALPLVAHNVAFDRTVYRKASEAMGVPARDADWYDTVVLARRHVPAANHRLDSVARALGLPSFHHHEAEADAVTCAHIALTIAAQREVTSVTDLWAEPSQSCAPQPG